MMTADEIWIDFKQGKLEAFYKNKITNCWYMLPGPWVLTMFFWQRTVYRMLFTKPTTSVILFRAHKPSMPFLHLHLPCCDRYLTPVYSINVNYWKAGEGASV